MSETVIFIVGVVIFAVTVWGAVMAGGLAMTRIEIEQNPDVGSEPDGNEVKQRWPFRSKY